MFEDFSALGMPSGPPGLTDPKENPDSAFTIGFAATVATAAIAATLI